MPGDQMRHLALPFQRAVDRQQPRTQQFAPLALGEVAPDDDVDVPRLVFQGEEGDAARGAGALAVKDDSSGACEAAVRQMAQFRGGEEPVVPQAVAQ